MQKIPPKGGAENFSLEFVFLCTAGDANKVNQHQLSKCLEAVIQESTPDDEVASSHIFMYELKTDKITEVM